MKNLLKLTYFFILAMLMFSVTAFAYIDPSSMTYIIQLVVGIVIAASAAAGFYFRRAKRAVAKITHKEDNVNNIDLAPEDDDDETGLGDYDLPEETKKKPEK